MAAHKWWNQRRGRGTTHGFGIGNVDPEDRTGDVAWCVCDQGDEDSYEIVCWRSKNVWVPVDGLTDAQKDEIQHEMLVEERATLRGRLEIVETLLKGELMEQKEE